MPIIEAETSEGLICPMNATHTRPLRLLAAAALPLAFSLAALGQTPAIVIQPTNRYVAAGLTTTLVSTFSGSSSPQYQWQFNHSNIPGSSGVSSPAILTLANAQLSDVGSYRLVVTNNFGSATSIDAVLIVGTVATWGANLVRGFTNVPLEVTNVSSVGFGLSQCLAVRSNGTVAAWTPDTLLATNAPASLTNIVAVAGGTSHGVALRSDGTVVCWGSNNQGQTNVPAGLTNMIGIAAGGNQSLALRSDGTVVFWGDNSLHRRTVPFGTRATFIVAGGDHCLAATWQGTIAAWGSGGANVTGVPTGLSNVIAVTAGTSHSLALRSDGTVVAWGSNLSGQTNVPSSASNVVSIAGAGDSSFAIRADGSVIGWGSNPDTILTPPTGFSNVISLTAGSQFGLGLRNFGEPFFTVKPASQTVWAGQGRTLYSAAAGVQPMSYQWQFNNLPIPGATDHSLALTNCQATNTGSYTVVISNAMGAATSVVAVLTVRQQPSVAAWGRNASGESIVPPGLSNIVAAAGGSGHSLILRDDGSVFGWGRSGGFQSLVPANLSNAVAIGCGEQFNAALRSDGTVACWGTPYSSSFFFNTATLSGLSAIAAGTYHLLGLSGGTVQAVSDFGAPTGPLGYEFPPSGLSGVTAIAAGNAHSLALKSDGSVVAWGNGFRGQTNIPPGLSNVMAIACGDSHQVALRSNGTVVAWGDNTYGQTSVPASLSNVVAISAYGYNTLALQSNRTVVGWGLDYDGQTSPPADLTNVIGIASGYNSSLALVGDSAPCITLPPRGITTPRGTVASFNATVSGTAPISLQWLHGAAQIPGATNLSLTISNLQAADAGAYTVVATNATGAATSTAVLTLGPIIGWGPYPYGVSFIPSRFTNATGIASGNFHNLILTSDGSVASVDDPFFTGALPLSVRILVAGEYSLGAILQDGSLFTSGFPSSTPTNAPFPLPPLQSVAMGLYHAVALSSDGRVFSWGPIDPYYDHGQTNVPAGLSNVVAVAGGESHSIALRDDGTVACWGNITNAPAGLSNVIAIAAARGHSLALRADGTIVAWGDSSLGLDTVPAGLSNVVAIASSTLNNFAIKSDGTLVGWGASTPSLAMQPPLLQNVVAVSAGLSEGMALLGDGKPFITVQPFNRRTTAAGSATLQLMVAGSPPFAYQWQFNGTNISGANGSSLSLTNLPLSASGEYRCIISNVFGMTTSAVSTVTVARPPVLFETDNGGLSVTNGSLRLRVKGLAQTGPVVLFSSTNLLDWQPIITNPPVLGTWEYSVPTGAAGRYFRAMESQ